MNDDLQVAVVNFKKALSSLEQGIKDAKGELEKDGVIQRFEFIFELMWKALKYSFSKKELNVNLQEIV